MPLRPSAQRSFLAAIDGIPGYWSVRTGGRKTSTVTRVYDGGARDADVIAGRAEHDDITCRRPYRSDRDGPLLKLLDTRVGRWPTTIIERDVDEDGVVIGQPRSWQVVLLSVTPPDHDEASNDGAFIELTFGVSRLS